MVEKVPPAKEVVLAQQFVASQLAVPEFAEDDVPELPRSPPPESLERDSEVEAEAAKSMSIVSSHTAADFTLLVLGYPSTSEEIEDLEASYYGLSRGRLSPGRLSLAVSDAVPGQLTGLQGAALQLWRPTLPPTCMARGAASGDTKTDEPDDTGGTWRVTRTQGAPEVLQDLRSRIVGAEDGSPFLSAVITELPGCHLWAAPSDPEEEAAPSFEDQEDEGTPPMPTDLYECLAASVDSSHHDVPFLLYCLCEQVNHSLRGDAPEVVAGKKKRSPQQVQDAAKKDFKEMNAFLDQASDILLLGKDAPKDEDEEVQPEGSLIDMMEKEEAAAQGKVEEQPYIPGMGPPPGVGSVPSDTGDEYVIPYYDRVSCRHAGDRLAGGKSVMLELLSLR
ncbi:unnamed protein product [Symbiodinium natans]|uniref:Uncharacterized protein n=1 Tax=Symbiodinium natans TaxID=878477 RepID=A0A812TDD8_9DINO|nr:unnamed protein product [Symbiodinium natans]